MKLRHLGLQLIAIGTVAVPSKATGQNTGQEATDLAVPAAIGVASSIVRGLDNADLVLACTRPLRGEGGGVFLSQDGGSSWLPSLNLAPQPCADLYWDEGTTPARLIAVFEEGLTGPASRWESTDLGFSWREIAGSERHTTQSLDRAPSGPCASCSLAVRLAVSEPQNATAQDLRRRKLPAQS